MTANFFPISGEVQLQRRLLRERALAAREALAPAVRNGLTQSIERHLDGLIETLQPSVIAFCWPYRAEPDLRTWVARWLGQGVGRSASLPVVIDKNAAMVFRGWAPGDALQNDRHGIPFPAEGEVVMPDVVLVPLNAFDARGYRLGYGGGYFDRTLAEMDVGTVGVGFELGRVDSVLPQAHDRAMDWVVTEAGALAAAGG